jgi:aldose 1-epimerase
MSAEITWITAAGQRLGLVPSLGGGVADWSRLAGDAVQPLWRPWTRSSEDRYSLANFAMLPWSNRISRGGFEHRGQWHAMTPNRAGEAYPIHGDAWLQPWTISQPSPAVAEMRLSSRHHGGNPYAYDALQRYELHEAGLTQTIVVTHRGEQPLPYGIGLHPWFPRTPRTTVQARVDGVWLSGADPIPTGHSREFPASWDLNPGANMNGSLIDNGYSGWDGEATITWPERGLALQVRMDPLQTPRGVVSPAYCLIYRPPIGEAFCFEPITQPIDAFHLDGRPGLVELTKGEAVTMRVHWRIHTDASIPPQSR